MKSKDYETIECFAIYFPYHIDIVFANWRLGSVNQRISVVNQRIRILYVSFAIANDTFPFSNESFSTACWMWVGHGLEVGLKAQIFSVRAT